MKFASILSLAVVAALLSGCTSDGSADGLTRAGRTALDTHHAAGDAVTAANLMVWPVYSDAPQEVGTYLTLKEALEKGVAEVRERGAAGEAPLTRDWTAK